MKRSRDDVADKFNAAKQASRVTKAMLVQMFAFGVVFSVLLLGVTWLSAETWRLFLGYESLWWVIAPEILVVSFVPLTFIGFIKRNTLVRVLSVISSISLGFLNFAFFAALVCWMIYGVTNLVPLVPDMRLVTFVAYGVALMTCVCGLINAAWLRTTRATVRLSNLPESWQGRDIALVSDVHLGSVLGHSHAWRIVSRLQKLNPFAVFISGDMFDGPESEPDAVVEPWSALQAQKGVYFVSGNHDEFRERSMALAALERVGIRVLHNEKVCVDGMQILGVHDGETRNRRLYAEIIGKMNLSPGIPSILMVHQPDNLDIPEQAGVSLQLSGHTHGGQFWPWNLVVSGLYGRSSYGLSRIGAMQLFTSSGAGTWGPPMRVGTRSEIVILHLERESGDSLAVSSH